MTYDEATESRVTLRQAIAELARHSIIADHEGAELFDCTTGETIAMAGADGLYSGAAILAWLGY